MVSAEGPITAAELGRHLDLTPAAVRRHLDALVEQGTVVEHEPAGGKRGRGRPARAYVVSEAGHGSLEADYDSLAVEVLRYLSEHGGPQAVADFARNRVGALETRYAAELAAAGDDPAARAETLVDLLSQDGFAASARPVGVGSLAGVQLCQGHCPVQHAAEQFPAFCEAETDAFSRLLGVHVQRLATLAGGHHVCTTFIPASGLARKPETATGVDQRVPGAQVTTPAERAQRHTTTTNEPTKERSRS
jgi:predicted ArsR family transcriptional regulator